MTSAAANSAAKTLGGSSRNRPSRSMSQQGSNSDAPTNNQSGPPNSSQFESLSERLLRENESSGAPGSGNGPGGGGGPDGRKVRFSETAALASTLDAANANPNDDDNDNDPNNSNRPQRSPLDVISDLFQNNKYALPTFLVMAAGIFALVHLAGGPTSADDGLKRYSPQTTSTGTGRDGPNQQQLNVGGPDGDFGDIIFSLSPTIATGVGGGASMTPTSEAGIHMTPKIAPVTSPSEQTGNQPGWIVVPTSSGEFGHAKGDQQTLKWNYPEGAPTPDPALLYDADGASQVGLKWNYPEGEPTPDPALLWNASPGSPTTMSWNYPPGWPTPDPIKLNAGSPTTMKWNYPPGVPTPDPNMLVEVAPPDGGAPTTLKWGGIPVPDKDAPGSPTTLKWGFPFGSPTPDPALLNPGSPTTLTWGYPASEPTPDPALLAGGNVPAAQVPDTMNWGYPPGVPTPDPDLLIEVAGPDTTLDWAGSPSPTLNPTQRRVENGKIFVPPTDPPTKSPTSPPTKMPTKAPHPVNMVDDELFPPRPVEEPLESPVDPEIFPMAPDPIKPPPVTPPPISVPQVEVNPVPPPPPPGNSRPTDPVPAPPTPDIVYPIEVAPPPVPVPKPPRAPRPPPMLPPSPQVNSRPYAGNGDGGYWYGGGSGSGYNIGGSGPQQPRDPVVTQGYSGTGGYIGGGYGIMQPQQVQYLPMNVGCIPCLMTSQMQQEIVDENVCPGHTQCIVNEQVQTHGRSNEDDAIFEIFYTNPMKCCGTIVEIGAGDGLTGSASYFFQHAMDWNSIVTEANPVDFDKIADNRQGDKLATINGAFCLESEQISFDGASGNFKQHHADEYTSEVVVKELPNNGKAETIDCIRLDRHVLAGLDHVDVMVIRVKGDPWAVIRTMDWNVQVDVWVILMEEKEGMHHDALRASLRSHEYVPAAWDVKLWCDTPKDCMENEVWLRKNFNPLPQQQQTQMMGMHGMQARGLRGSSGGMFLPYRY